MYNAHPQWSGLRLRAPLVAVVMAAALASSSARAEILQPFISDMEAYSPDNLCVDIAGASRAPGADAIIHQCHYGDNQQWLFEYYVSDEWGNHWYQIRSVHSGQCLDVQGASITPGANVIQWPCSGDDNQLWLFEDRVWDGNVIYRGNWLNRGSGLCLDVHGGQISSGADARQWNCHSGANQIFSIVSWQGSPGTAW